MSPDWSEDPDPVPYADFENPQSLNLYSYLTDNPLGAVDPDGHDCGGSTTYTQYDHEGDVVQSSTTTEDPCPDWSMWAHVFDQGFSALKQGGQVAFHYLAAPRNMGCLSSATSGGAAAGNGTGALVGLAGGPFAEVTVPAGATGGFLMGGVGGFAAGLSACMTGGGGGAGGGGAEEGGSKKPPVKATKLKGNQGWRHENGDIWKKDMLHKDHWDVSDRAGNKIKEVTFDGRELWPNGPKSAQ